MNIERKICMAGTRFWTLTVLKQKILINRMEEEEYSPCQAEPQHVRCAQAEAGIMQRLV